jgi:hypothetical protein
VWHVGGVRLFLGRFCRSGGDDAIVRNPFPRFE